MDTKVKPVEVLPLVKYYMEQLGLARLFDKFVPNSNGAEVAPSQVLCLLVMNIMVSAKPLYRVEEWLHDYLDGVTEERVEAAKYNDDRLGRNLDLLFAADRASFLTELSAKAIVVSGGPNPRKNGGLSGVEGVLGRASSCAEALRMGRVRMAVDRQGRRGRVGRSRAW
jgi:hypothetical protein